MEVAPLSVPGAFVVTPVLHRDERGHFCEWLRQDVLAAAVGHPLELAQANLSSSRRGVVRGVHYADVPPGQAKYVCCPSGAVLDVVVDLREGSPTFGRSEAVRLDEENRRGVYLAEGLGHAFVSLADPSVVSYLCSTPYTPAAEHAVHPLDSDLALPWPREEELLLSPRDQQAPSLAEARAGGSLPGWDRCQARYAELARRAGNPGDGQ